MVYFWCRLYFGGDVFKIDNPRYNKLKCPISIEVHILNINKFALPIAANSIGLCHCLYNNSIMILFLYTVDVRHFYFAYLAVGFF